MNKQESKVYAVAPAYQLLHIKRHETIHTPYPKAFKTLCQDNLNNAPRKVLGFRTPLEGKSSFGCVALHC